MASPPAFNGSDDTARTQVAEDFRLMQGGPIFRLMVKLRLEGLENAYVGRRSLLLIAITWCPLFLLSLAQNLAFPGSVRIPFIFDFPQHVLYLVTLPLLIIAEIVIEPGVSKAIAKFLERGLIREGDRPAFDSILAWARGKCESGRSELVIVLLAGLPIVFFRGERWTQNLVDSWSMRPDGAGLSIAGWWGFFVGAFFARVFLYRWVWRLIIWTGLLRRMARLDLQTMATHPDRAGGLGFLSEVEMRFGILAFAVGLVVSANVAANILFHHSSLAAEKMPVIAYIVGATVVLMLPLLVLAGTLNKTWRRGMDTYGNLASDYVRRFERKWIQGENPGGDELLGTGDMQSLADLSNSYQIVQEIKLLPVNRRCILSLIISAALPMVPLVVLDPWAMEIAKILFRKLL